MAKSHLLNEASIQEENKQILLNKFNTCLLDSHAKVIYRTNNRLLWEETCTKLQYFPITYLGSFIDYQLAYSKAGSEYGRTDNDLTDVSMILIHDDEPIGIWPLSLSQDQNVNNISSYGCPILPPLYVKGTSEKIVKRSTRSCVAVLKAYQSENPAVEKMNIESGYFFLGLNEWHRCLMENNAIVNLKHELYIDLSLDLQSIKSGFRKSYKSLLNSGEKEWETGLINDKNIEVSKTVWNDYRKLHVSISGRETRSRKTWDMQYQLIADSHAFLVYLRNQNQELVGGGLFTTTKDEGIYSVGVYDRSLFDKPLGHVVQWNAIHEMKRRGVKWYHIGRRYYPSDDPQPTEKEMSISFFKEGFSTHLFSQFHIETSFLLGES